MAEFTNLVPNQIASEPTGLLMQSELPLWKQQTGIPRLRPEGMSVCFQSPGRKQAGCVVRVLKPHPKPRKQESIHRWETDAAIKRRNLYIIKPALRQALAFSEWRLRGGDSCASDRLFRLFLCWPPEGHVGQQDNRGSPREPRLGKNS